MKTKLYTCRVCKSEFEGDPGKDKFGKNKNCSLICNGKATQKHGKSQSVLYRKYASLKQRCNSQQATSYKHYGGRGIKCLWESFEDFYDDMAESYFEHVKKHGQCDSTIDRIDNDRHYCKENCRWQTVKQQCYNKTNNVTLNIDGEEMFLPEVAKKFNININTIKTRMYRGWETREVLRPARTYGS